MAGIGDSIKSYAKKYGVEHAALGAKLRDIERARSGVFQFDLASGGGFPRGKVSICYGKECIKGDTRLSYHALRPDGSPLNVKGGTIENLWYRFHNVKRYGLGYYKRKASNSCSYTVPSVNEEGAIFHNRIADVVKCGMKQLYRLETASGKVIKATAKHKFWNGTRYVLLSDLKEGDTIYVHDNVPYKGRKQAPNRPEVMVKHHPYAKARVVSGSRYKRLTRARFVYEATMNGIDCDEYRYRLNEGQLGGLVFADPEKHVHHLDENCLNDEPSNLILISGPDRNREHAKDNHNKLRFIAVPDVVVSIAEGDYAMTYDLTMAGLHKNYVADGFVVHNSSGKTNLALKTMGNQQLDLPDEKAVFIDVEHSLDPGWAQQMGVDPTQLVLFEPDYGEEAIDMLVSSIEADDVSIITLDSLAALVTEKEIENDSSKQQVAGNSLLVGKAMRKTVAALTKAAKNDRFPVVILINQIRTKVGLVYGSPDYQPGGNALRHTSGLTVKIYGKNEIDKSFSSVIPAYKDTKLTIEKWKVPIVQISCEYKMAMLATDDLGVGEVEEWNTVAHYLREMKQLKKLGPNGWLCMGKEFKTLAAAQSWLITEPSKLAKAKNLIIEAELAKLKKTTQP